MMRFGSCGRRHGRCRPTAIVRWSTPLGTLGLILIVDRHIWEPEVGLIRQALADEAAHIAFTVMLLTPYSSRLSKSFVGGALAGSVALDLDHIPIYVSHSSAARSRPMTHSLAAVVTALIVALGTGGHTRRIACGASFGLTSHLVRDLLTGGVPLLWPLSDRVIKVGTRGLPARSHLVMKVGALVGG